MPEVKAKRPRYWVHFKTLNAGVWFEPILKHYELEFQKIGSRLAGHCPFHDSARPLLMIYLTKRFFHCFDCGANGNPLDFVAKLENVSVEEAAEIVARICGIGILPDDNSNQIPAEKAPCSKTA